MASVQAHRNSVSQVHFHGAEAEIAALVESSGSLTLLGEPPTAVEESSAAPQQHGVHSFASADEISLVFQNLSLEVDIPAKKGEPAETRKILKGLSGEFRPGRLVALMGASGSGKTSLLSCLGGRMNFKARLSGRVLVNGHQVEPELIRSKYSAYVYQDDLMMETMTVREILYFAARLKLPESMSEDAKRSRVEEIIEALGLTKAADTIIGSASGTASEKGISGGEKRRVSLGMELITSPSIILLDEVTTGLDTFSSFSIIHLLRSLAHQQRRTIICTIHQPSSDIFHMFDDLLLLADGAGLYQGPVKAVVPYFAKLDYNCPKYSNPADYLFMTVLNAELHGKKSTDKNGLKLLKLGSQNSSKAAGSEKILQEEKIPDSPAHSSSPAAAEDSSVREARAAELEAKEKERLEILLKAWQESPENFALTQAIESPVVGDLPAREFSSSRQFSASFSTQFELLARRAWFNQFRNPLLFNAKLGQTIFIALIIGLIYLRIGVTQKNIQDREGAIFFITVNGMLGATMATINVFGIEKQIFMREYLANLYSLPTYFLSRTLVEIPVRILLPIVGSTIAYFMIGLNEQADRWIIFCIASILLDFCGTSMGILAACVFPELEVALASIQLILMPVMIFSGFFVNEENIPAYFNWIKYISPVRYTFMALIKNEFEGRTLECTQSELVEDGGILRCPMTTGEQVIKVLEFDNQPTIGQNLLIILALTFGCSLIAYFTMRRTTMKIIK